VATVVDPALSTVEKTEGIGVDSALFGRVRGGNGVRVERDCDAHEGACIMQNTPLHHVVIIGGGFGGLYAAKRRFS
jgi:hypothetical protein